MNPSNAAISRLRRVEAKLTRLLSADTASVQALIANLREDEIGAALDSATDFLVDLRRMADDLQQARAALGDHEAIEENWLDY